MQAVSRSNVFRLCRTLALLFAAGFPACWFAAKLLHSERNVMAAEGSPEMMLAHNVFFSLKDSNEQNRQKLVDSCHKYLSSHEGTVFYAAGLVASDLDRPVNDRDWDVGLHVIFKTKADHDRYQTHPEHLKFIEENKETWAKVRVFDSYVQGSR